MTPPLKTRIAIAYTFTATSVHLADEERQANHRKGAKCWGATQEVHQALIIFIICAFSRTEVSVEQVVEFELEQAAVSFNHQLCWVSLKVLSAQALSPEIATTMSWFWIADSIPIYFRCHLSFFSSYFFWPFLVYLHALILDHFLSSFPPLWFPAPPQNVCAALSCVTTVYCCLLPPPASKQRV